MHGPVPALEVFWAYGDSLVANCTFEGKHTGQARLCQHDRGKLLMHDINFVESGTWTSRIVNSSNATLVQLRVIDFDLTGAAMVPSIAIVDKTAAATTTFDIRGVTVRQGHVTHLICGNIVCGTGVFTATGTAGTAGNFSFYRSSTTASFENRTGTAVDVLVNLELVMA